jgi:hypothetical protein
MELGDLDAAREIACGQLAQIGQRVAGDAHYVEGMAALVQGKLECLLGDGSSGVQRGAEGDARVSERYGEMHVYRLDTLWVLGDTQRSAGLFPQARATFEHGLEVAAANGLDEHPRVADHLLGIAAVEDAEQNPGPARDARSKAAAVLALCLGPSSKRVLALQPTPVHS